MTPSCQKKKKLRFSFFGKEKRSFFFRTLENSVFPLIRESFQGFSDVFLNT